MVKILCFFALSILYLLYEVYFGAGKKMDIRIDLILLLPLMAILFSYLAEFITKKKLMRFLIGIIWSIILIVFAGTFLFGVTYGK